MKRYTFVAVAILLIAAGFFVRLQNGRDARDQAKAIVAADQASQPTAALEVGLADYAKSHLGAGVTYTLEGSYNRAVAAARAAAAAASATSSQIYADAQRVCAGKTSSVTQAKCNQDYVSSNLKPVPASDVAPPSRSAFVRTVASPIWTADLSGALLVGGIAALLVGLAQLLPRRK